MTVGGPTPHTMTRRSTRVRARIPILITSLDPAIPFSFLCDTLIVNAHGCAAKVPQPLEIGMPVRLRIRESREVTARIVVCQPIAGGQPSWVTGFELDKPGNIWGLTPVPEDWARFDQEAEECKAGGPATTRTRLELKMPVWPLASPSTKSGLPAKAQEELKMQLAAQQETIASLEDRLATAMASVPGVVRQQLADAQQETLAQVRKQLGAMLAQSVQEQVPAQADAIARLQERLASFESLPSAVREQLAEARASLASISETVRKQLADAQQETLAQARQQLSAMLAQSVQEQFTTQSNAIARLQERLASFESLPSAVREQLAEARASLASISETVRKQLADAQQETLAQARQQLSAMLAQSVQEQFTTQSNAIARLQERLASVESLPSAVREQLAEARASLASISETVRKQLADAQQETLAQVRQQLGAMLAESVQEQVPAQADAIARLQERLASLESLPSMVGQQLSDAHEQTQAQVRQQLGASLAEFLKPLQEELAVCRKKAEDAQQIRAAVAEQFEQLPWHIEQHTRAAFRPLQERARAELEGIIAEARSQDEQETARRQALQASAQALQEELAQARASLESSMRSLPARIQAPIAAAVEDALARGRAEISAALARELEALHERGRMVADELRAAAESLRSEREATRAQIQEAGAQREELRLWLAEQQASYTQQVGRQLEQLASELATRSGGVLEERIRSDVQIQVERAEADLNQRLRPMLDRAADLRQEALSLLGALQRENERCQTQMRALLEEKDSVDDWIKERAAEFQKTFHDALVETTGQIKGRLQMAVEMIEQPVAKLRDQAAQQLQEQAGRQARHLREHADEACDRVTRLQRDIENSVREALRAQAAETSATCGREIAQLAQRSVEEWRSALARNLESIANLLGQKLPGGEG